MPKKVRCCECKYCKPLSKKRGTYPPLSIKGVALSVSQSFDKLYECEAVLGRIVIEDAIQREIECPYFRSRTKTAWEEVKEGVWSKIKEVLNPSNWIKALFKK